MGFLWLGVLCGVASLLLKRKKRKSASKSTSKWFGPLAGLVILIALFGAGKPVVTKVLHHAPAVTTYAPPSSPSGNVLLGKKMAAPYGWSSGSEWDCLYTLWTRESGWDSAALNESSGATGIPQLLPGAHAIPADWSDPRVQIAWGLSYIKNRWGTPCGALSVYCNHPQGPPGCWY
jgi:hypothetical protein